MIYRFYDEEKQEEIKNLLQLEADSLLIASAELLQYPPEMGNLLSYYLFAFDLPSAVDNHLSHCLWAFEFNAEFEAKISEYMYYGQEDQVEEQKTSKAMEIHAVALKHLVKRHNPKEIINIWRPFYDSFWREILFQNKLFAEVVNVCRIFAKAVEESWYLFDFAYGINATGESTLAAQIYSKLLQKEPNNSSAYNNLGVIHENQGEIQEAHRLFSRAAELDSSEKLYKSNLIRMSQQISIREKAQGNLAKALRTIQEKASEAGLTSEQHKELSEFYWDSKIPIKEIQELYNSRNIYDLITPVFSGTICPNCFVQLMYKNRTARASNDAVCLGCEHKLSGWCRCEYCRRQEEARRQQMEAARLRDANEAFQQLQQRYCTEDYVEWAIDKLNRKQKQFLKGFIEVINSSDAPSWEEICVRSGVVSHKSYLQKLEDLKLLLRKPEVGIISNSAITLDMLQLETVRKISKSLRFDVFQRDNHTCQYCGRKPPQVTLVIDHLVPVSKGGTDDINNLVTSCDDCNSGKSDKLIESFTGGHSKEEWRQQIQGKRAEILNLRRKNIDNVFQHWRQCLDKKTLAETDKEAIYNFVELYEPEWINWAISITVQKKIPDYVKYTAGILRNWAKDGVPEFLANPNATLEDKGATERQIEYIQSLLNGLGLDISEFYHKSNYDELTMLDAKNLIDELTRKRNAT